MKFNLKILFLLLTSVFLGIIIVAVVYVKYQSKTIRSYNTQTTLPVVKQAKGQLVAGFPDLPIFPGARITSTQHAEAVSAPFYQPASYQAYLQSDKSVPEIIGWYTKNLQAAGWKMITPADPSTPSDQSIVMTKNSLTVSINVESGSESDISIDIRQTK
jgi:hypothetical protein